LFYIFVSGVGCLRDYLAEPETPKEFYRDTGTVFFRLMRNFLDNEDVSKLWPVLNGIVAEKDLLDEVHSSSSSSSTMRCTFTESDAENSTELRHRILLTLRDAISQLPSKMNEELSELWRCCTIILT
jgi:hypothetical protein